MTGNIRIIISVIAALIMIPGRIMGQRIEAEQADIHCGNVKYKNPVTAVFKLKNAGERKLVINDVEVGCGCLEADYPKGEIGVGENFELRLTYDAKQLGHFYKEARILSNASPIYLSMQGVVMDRTSEFRGQYSFTIGDIGTDIRDIEFDDVNKGDMPTADIHIVNKGTDVLEPSIMHLPQYISADITPKYLSPGRSGRIRLTLNSSLLNDYGIIQTSIYLANSLGETVSEDNEITLSAVLLPSFTSLTPTERLNAPKISLSAERLTVNFEGKSKRTEKVEITNRGKTPLEISTIHLYSSALQVTLGNSRIEPGETAIMKITVDRGEAAKARVRPRVLLITNDPDKPKVVIDVETI